MSGPQPRDPFALTADPELYVPRPATERALDQLAAALEGGGPALLSGPGGLGKTLLLHVLARRGAERWRGVYLPYAALAPRDLEAWVCTALDEAAPDPSDEEPEPVLRTLVDALQEEGQGLLILLDDGGALPLETARWLGTVAVRCRPALRLVVAAGDRAASAPTLAALGPSVPVRLTEPMDERESEAYVRARLERTGASARVRARLAEAAVRRLHAISGGNPRRLHIAASDLLRGGSGEVPEDRFGSADELAEAAPREFRDGD